MRVILTDKSLDGCGFPADVEVKKCSIKNLGEYDGNAEVVAISGSRAMAIQAVQMRLPSLKLFQLTSAGFDGVPGEEYAKRGVAVANAGSVYSQPIAETVVFGMLLMAKKLHANPNNRHLKIQRHYSTITELADKAVLIMGAGNIGTAIAKRLGGFDMCIEGYDPFCPEKPEYRRMLRTREDLMQNMGRYSYVISTMPDNEQTRGFINAELLQKMNANTVIVNVGRKAVFNQDDLYQVLKEKRIAGAVLDMFEKLPNPITNRFRRLHNTIVLPGVSAISQEVNGRLKEHMYRNLLAYVQGEKINYVINGVK